MHHLQQQTLPKLAGSRQQRGEAGKWCVEHKFAPVTRLSVKRDLCGEQTSRGAGWGGRAYREDGTSAYQMTMLRLGKHAGIHWLRGADGEE